MTDIHFTLRSEVAWVNADSWPEAGGCNVLCLTDRQLSILRQLAYPRCLAETSFVVPVFDRWYTFPTAELYADYVDECDELVDKLGKGACVDCSNFVALLQQVADSLSPADVALLYGTNLTLPAGNSNQTIWTCNAGETAIVTLVTVKYVGTSATSLRMYVDRSSIAYPVAEVLAPVSNNLYTFAGPYYLGAGDILYVRIFGATLNDDIYVSANGRAVVLPVLE